MEVESKARMRNFGPKETFYRHFKGNIYRFAGIAKDSETLEEMVVYQAMYGDGQMWFRPRELPFWVASRPNSGALKWLATNVLWIIPWVKMTKELCVRYCLSGS